MLGWFVVRSWKSLVSEGGERVTIKFTNPAEADLLKNRAEGAYGGEPVPSTSTVRRSRY
jgi:hypothetical protein